MLILTSMAALVAECGSVWHDSVAFPKIPAFKNLPKEHYKTVLVFFLNKLIKMLENKYYKQHK